MSKFPRQLKSAPELRFPGYKNNWNKVRLGKVARFSKGSPLAKSDISLDGVNECIHYGELFTQYGNLISEIKSKTNVSKEKSKLSIENDVLMPTSDVTPSGLATASAINKENVILGGDILIINSEALNNLFFSYYISSHKKDVMRLVQGVTVYHLYSSHLASLDVIYPEIQEQKKISDYLSKIDEYVVNLKSQKDKIEVYKTGMMQKIFSQELRFKDKNGKNFPDWQTVRLGKIIEERTERAGSKNYDLLSITMKNGVKKYDDSLKKDSSSGDKSNYKVVRKNDIAYNTMRMWQGASGVSAFEGVVSPAYTVVAPKNGDPDFFGYLFKMPRVVFDFYRYSQGLTSDTWNLKFKHFKEIKVTVPTSKDEQLEISNFLKSIDELIEFKSKQIEKAETWKRGLLQKMFV
ncbi:restriction endonuclease subunit S [Candidatus Kaiserbacteria bacterium]|nr:restriction endonuclease subunit S [Candidatus Kaiserbacteria bacterium]